MRARRGRRGNLCFFRHQNWVSTIFFGFSKHRANVPELRNTAEARHLSNNRQHVMKRPFFFFFQKFYFTEKPTISTSPQARREQQQQNVSAIISFSFGTPEEAVMSNLRVHPQFESRYNALGDLSNPGGCPHRVKFNESGFNRTNPEPIYRRSIWFWDALNANTLPETPYMMCRKYDYYSY